jgi:nucleoside 2-deoxyribosyltransferase
MRVFLSIKYHEDQSNRHLIECIVDLLTKAGHQACCIVRDVEHWGDVAYGPKELMELTFRQIDGSDLVLVEITEKGVGLGIEAGYACAKGIPVVTIARRGADIPQTLRGISSRVLLYDACDELPGILHQLRSI